MLARGKKDNYKKNSDRKKKVSKNGNERNEGVIEKYRQTQKKITKREYLTN